MGDERGLVAQHPVQDDRELACEGDLGLAQTHALGDVVGPGLQVRSLHRPRQDDIGGLIEGRAHPSDADLGDPPGVVRLAGLVLLGREAKMGANRAS